MAQLVVAAAGAALGGFIAPGIVAFGMTGASIGWMAGSMLGSAFAPTQKSSGPQLSDLSVSTSAYGTPIPYVQGHPRIAGQIVWASTKREIATTEEVGKGGGGAEYTSYTYEVDLLILLTDNEIGGVTRIWSNGELVYSILTASDAATLLASQTTELWSRVTAYTGAADQLPDPDYEAAVGTANAPAYRGRGSIFIKSLQLGGSGQIPNLTFEVGTITGSTPVTSNVLLQSHLATATSLDESCQDNRGTSVKSPHFTGVNASGWNLAGDESLAEYDQFGWANLSFLTSGDLTVEVNITAGTPAGTVFEITSVSPFFSFLADTSVDSSAFSVSLRGNYFRNELKVNINGAGEVTVPGAFPGNIRLAIVQPGTPSVGNPTKIYINDGLVWSYAGKAITSTCQTVAFGGAVLYPQGGQTYPFAYNSIRIRRGLFSDDLDYGPYDPAVCAISLLGARLNETIVDVVDRLCTRSGLAPAQYSTAALSAITKPVRSMAISSVSSARTVLDMLAASYHFDAVLSDKIYFRPRASAPAATLTFNELGVIVDSGSSPDPLPLTQANELEIPAQMALTYSNVDGDYQTDTQYSDRLLTGQESTSAMQVPLGFTATEAKQIVDAMLLDKAVSALTTSVSLGVTRAALEPTDVVLLTGEDGSSYRIRIVKKAEASGVTTLECVQDDSTVFTQTGTTAGGTASQTVVLATPTTTLELLDVPLLRDVDNLPGHYVAVKGSAANWTSTGLYESMDNLTYTPNTTISSQAVMGTCTTALADWAGGNVFDEVSSVTVNVGTQQLASVTREDILASQTTNAALIGSEVLQYRTATLVSAGVYTLSGFLRGQRGTASTGHGASDRFIVLASGGLRFVPLQQGDLGRLRYYKAASAGQRLSAVTSQSLTPAGITLKPFAPVDARANRDTADTVLTWIRQTRLSTRIVGTLGISSPLGEAAEAYEVEIYTAGHAALLRTLTSATPSVTYTSAQQLTDFGSGQSVIAVKIYQISATVGRGTPLITTV